MTETERAEMIEDVLRSEDPEVRQFIKDLLHYADEWRKPDPWTGESRNIQKRPFYTSRPINLPVILWIGNPKTTEATILYETYQWAQIFEGADLTRLRRCPVCETIYWAFPSHKRGCKAACANTVAKRKERLSHANRQGRK